MDKVITNSSQRVSFPYNGQTHTGIDLKISNNEQDNQVFAHSSGVVVVIRDGYERWIGSTGMTSYGNYIDIDHGNGYITRYAHLKKNSICVSLGQKVTNKTRIAVIGNSGNTLGPTGRHLHFEVLKDGKRINPELFLTKEFELHPITYQSHDKRYKWNPNVLIDTLEYAGNFGIDIDGIYLDKYKMRVHDKIKHEWLPWVMDRNDYAGNLGHPIDGVQIKNVSYRVHLTNGSWLSWIHKCDDTPEGYAGIYGFAIDAIQIKR